MALATLIARGAIRQVVALEAWPMSRSFGGPSRQPYDRRGRQVCRVDPGPAGDFQAEAGVDETAFVLSDERLPEGGALSNGSLLDAWRRRSENFALCGILTRCEGSPMLAAAVLRSARPLVRLRAQDGHDHHSFSRSNWPSMMKQHDEALGGMQDHGSSHGMQRFPAGRRADG